LDDNDFCSRTVFAMSLGVVSGVVAFLWMILGAKLPAIVDTILGWLMLAAWVFGIGYITFGDKEDVPARNIGNLYFATWAGFIISCLLASGSLRALFHSKFGDGEGENTTEEAKEPEKAANEEDMPVDEENAAPVDEVAADTEDDKK
jgi:amino acid transporter